MITKLLKEVNEKLEILNKLLGDEDYINKLEKKIDDFNNSYNFMLKYGNKIVKPEDVSIFKEELEKSYYEDYQELKNRIYNAIKCINYYATEDEDYSKPYDIEEEELLKILRGEDNGR